MALPHECQLGNTDVTSYHSIYGQAFLLKVHPTESEFNPIHYMDLLFVGPDNEEEHRQKRRKKKQLSFVDKVRWQSY